MGVVPISAEYYLVIKITFPVNSGGEFMPVSSPNLFESQLCAHGKNRKILANLRSKTFFQQVGQVSARKLKNVKSLRFLR